TSLCYGLAMPAGARTQLLNNQDKTAMQKPATPKTDRPESSAGEGILADRAFKSVIYACAFALMTIVGLVLFELITASRLTLHTTGFKFLTRSIWDPVAEDFGALPFIYGTLVSSLV